MAWDDVVRLRRCVQSFLLERVLPEVRPGDRVLEIGPAHPGSCPVPDAFVDVKAAVLAAGATYLSVDPDPAAKADITADFLQAEAFYGDDQFDKIIACEVFEHVPNVWQAPKAIHSLLAPGGTLYFSTPFLFEQHSPSPDCWRFCADGLRHLFGGLFSLEVIASDSGPSPLHYSCIGRTDGSSRPTAPVLRPAWMQRPHLVDPPSGWRYGFPRLYDPATDGDVTEWLIAHGYPESLARQGLPCTMTSHDPDGASDATRP